MEITSGLDDLLDDVEDDNNSLHLDKTVPDELDYGDYVAFLDEVAFVDVDIKVELAAINVAALAPDLKDMAIVPDCSGLTRFKDLDKRWNLIKAQNFLLSDSDSSDDEDHQGGDDIIMGGDGVSTGVTPPLLGALQDLHHMTDGYTG